MGKSGELYAFDGPLTGIYFGACINVLLTSSLRLLTNRTPLDPACPAKATLPAAAAAAAAALRGLRAPDKK